MRGNPSRREFVRNIGSGLAALPFLPLLSCENGAGRRPNIVLIMSDDMGFSDIGCYGSEIHTPNLDQLAAGGLRFTQFYNCARCCPTRASLLTGLYPHQTGIGHMVDADHPQEAYQGDLNQNCMTIAEVLKQAGYATYMSGKWHVTPHVSPEGPKHNWPLQRGFDRFFGTIDGAGSFYDPHSLTEDNTQITPDEDFYYTDAISDKSAQFIREHKTDNPFFMYVSYTAAHWPMHALARDIEKYKGHYNRGWDSIREERYQRMIQMGLIDKNWKITDRDAEVPAWENEALKEWRIRCMEVYAAMIDNMDQGIGRILHTLKSRDQLDNTLIFFLQDNGGCAETIGIEHDYNPQQYAKEQNQPMQVGELQTRMIPQYTRDGRPVRSGRGLMPGPGDTYIGYGIGWANASNTPFRLYKHWVHEGGIATPLIVHWPQRIKARGQLRQQPGHLIDIMATCVAAAAADYPTSYNDQKIIPMEGRSLIGAFDNFSIDRDALFWEHEGNRALRVNNWKLVARVKHNRRYTESDKNSWELYDLEADRTETHNLAQSQPERLRQMIQQWEAWAQRTHTLPWPWEG